MADPVLLEVVIEPPPTIVEHIAEPPPLEVELAIPGPPGPPGPAAEDTFDADLALLYQIAKL